MTMVSPGTTNLVAWWALNETSGNRADSYGSNTLTDNNTVLYSASGIKGNAADFEKDNNESLTITDNGPLSLTGDITIAGWIKLESAPATRTGILTKTASTTATTGYALYYEIISGSLYLHFKIGGSSTYKIVYHTTPIADINWHFVYGKWVTSTQTLYVGVDSQTPTSGTTSITALADNTSPLALGGSFGGTSFDGLMDEMTLWNDDLSADNLEWLYNSGGGRTRSELDAIKVAAMMASYRRRRVA